MMLHPRRVLCRRTRPPPVALPGCAGSGRRVGDSVMHYEIMQGLALGSALLIGWGLVWLWVWRLDYRDASRYARHQADRLITWAQMEAAVIAAERAIGVRHG